MLSADLPPIGYENADDGGAPLAEEPGPSGSLGEDFPDRQPESFDTPELSSQLLELAEADGEEAEAIPSEDEPDLISIGSHNAIWGMRLAEKVSSPLRVASASAGQMVVVVDNDVESETPATVAPCSGGHPSGSSGSKDWVLAFLLLVFACMHIKNIFVWGRSTF